MGLKEKGLGTVLLAVGIILAAWYVILGIAALMMMIHHTTEYVYPYIGLEVTTESLTLWAMLPAVLVMLVLGVALAWIGYALIVTPPVEEIKVEEIEKEIEKEIGKEEKTS